MRLFFAAKNRQKKMTAWGMAITETTKPRQMMRRAVVPMAMVSGLELNRPMREPEMVRQRTVPTAMMAALRPSVRL